RTTPSRRRSRRGAISYASPWMLPSRVPILLSDKGPHRGYLTNIGAQRGFARKAATESRSPTDRPRVRRPRVQPCRAFLSACLAQGAGLLPVFGREKVGDGEGARLARQIDDAVRPQHGLAVGGEPGRHEDEA